MNKARELLDNINNHLTVANMLALDEQAVEVEQDWSSETTIYKFEDGSVLEDCCGSYTIL